jgi:hypothetical protein
LKCAVLSWAWLAFNQRTIDAEELIVCPAFAMMVRGRFPGSDRAVIKRTAAQAIVDESYHILMHLEGNLVTEERRRLRYGDAHLPAAFVWRQLRDLQMQIGDSHDADLLTLVFAIVSEVSISANLELLANDETIQPTNREIVKRHNRDERAHSPLITDMMKHLFVHMNRDLQARLITEIPKGVVAFTRTDFLLWRGILAHLNFPYGAEIIGDCELERRSSDVVQDYSGIRAFAEELEILDRIDFD